MKAKTQKENFFGSLSPHPRLKNVGKREWRNKKTRNRRRKLAKQTKRRMR